MDILIRIVADMMLLPLVVIGLWAALSRIRMWKELYPVVLMSGLTSFVVAKLISLVYQPSDVRPFVEKGLEPGASYMDNPGFPSDHMLFAVAIMCAVWYLVGVRSRTAVIVAALALAVGAGRVMALVHAPVDILGGVGAGLIGALWYLTSPRQTHRRDI